MSVALCAALALGGCALSPSGETSLASPQAVQGTLHGGQQPVVNATIQLIAPGLTGYGSAGSVLVSTTTNGSGLFTLPAFTCPANNGLVYFLATGGNPGAGTNNALALAAVTGPCGSLTSSTFVNIDEVTTAAAAYALAPFATISSGTMTIGTSATNLVGLKNAAGPAGNLANTTTGLARGVNELSGIVAPTAEINTLADILSACVNTGVVAGTSGTCASLFTAATPPGGAAPTDTFQAAVDIALNPGNNAAALYVLSTAIAPFQPTLGSAPGDFAVALQYTGGLIANSGFTSGLAIDAVGNVWVGNTIGVSPKSITEISPAGVVLSGTNGFANGIAGGNGFSIDSGGHLWVNVATLNEILELNSSGTVINTFTTPSLIKPTGIAVDNRTGSIWSANSNNQPSLNGGNSDFTGTTVTNATSTGVDAPGSPYGGGNGPFAVEIDAAGDVWVANTGANTTTTNISFLAKYTPPATAGNPYTVQTFITGTGSYPFELAFDSSSNVWVTLLNSVGEYSNAGALIGNFTASATNFPTAVMIDGLGRAFVTNGTSADSSTPGSVTVFSSSGTLISTSDSLKGYLAGNTIPGAPFSPTGLGIDPSGNVWISGIAIPSSTYQYVTELVGMAAPVTTPTTVASSTNKYGVRP